MGFLAVLIPTTGISEQTFWVDALILSGLRASGFEINPVILLP